MPMFSLIIATKHRTTELARLIQSIANQNEADYELIIVDQNDDERLLPIIQLSANKEKIRYIKCSTGLSLARNLGIEYAQGKIISFPDDDCWYPPGVLKSVASWFDSNQHHEILCLGLRDADGECVGNRWFISSCDLNMVNIYRTTMGPSIFIRSNGRTRAVQYDEGIGPGASTQYVAGEDTDYILELMKNGSRGRFEAKWHIGHPRKDIGIANVSMDRVYNYGKGTGFVQRKHRRLWIALVSFDFGRAICCFALGKSKQASLLYQHGRGLIAGFLAPTSHFGSREGHS
jgi:glycosyltransferase involved in cell wall biosynthesis